MLFMFLSRVPLLTQTNAARDALPYQVMLLLHVCQGGSGEDLSVIHGGRHTMHSQHANPLIQESSREWINPVTPIFEVLHNLWRIRVGNFDEGFDEDMVWLVIRQ